MFNLAPCENDFERKFSKFLDKAEDIIRFAKLPRPFGFAIVYTDAAMNLRCYYPDFVALDTTGVHWLLETKGQESQEVAFRFKDRAADQWCENATTLTEGCGGTGRRHRSISKPYNRRRWPIWRRWDKISRFPAERVVQNARIMVADCQGAFARGRVAQSG